VYKIIIDKYAIRQLKILPANEIPKIKAKIIELSHNPRPNGYIKLKGVEAYRVRLGDYRIIYEINDEKVIVTVIAIAHRREIYK
jgi:mRNA interferase RelE/StbE